MGVMSLRHALLGLLADRPGSGWDLLKRFESSLAFVWPATQSQLYTELGRMADDGLVEVTATGARNRKEYAATAAGRSELEQWLTGTEPERSRRNEALLRVFFLGSVDPAAARATSSVRPTPSTGSTRSWPGCATRRRGTTASSIASVGSHSSTACG